MTRFIDIHREEFSVEPICTLLQAHRPPITPRGPGRVGPCAARRPAQGGDQAGLGHQLSGLRRVRSSGSWPGRHRGSPDHVARLMSELASVSSSTAPSGGPPPDRRRPAPDRSGQPRLPLPGPRSPVGRRCRLCRHLGQDRLRGVFHRRLLPHDRRLGGGNHPAGRAGAGRPGVAVWARQDTGLDGLVHHSDRGGSISPSATPSAWPTRAQSARSAPGVTAPTTRSPRRSTSCPRRSRSAAAAPGGPPNRSSWPPWHRSSGGTNAACTARSATCHPQDAKPPTTVAPTVQGGRVTPTVQASINPRTVQLSSPGPDSTVMRTPPPGPEWVHASHLRNARPGLLVHMILRRSSPAARSFVQRGAPP